MPPPPQRPRNHPKRPQGPGDAPKGSETPTIQSNKQGLGTGPLVGIIAGSIVAVLCVFLLLVYCICNAQKRTDDASSESKDFVGPLTVNIERGMALFMMYNAMLQYTSWLMLDKYRLFS
jgi:hypothetical protein